MDRHSNFHINDDNFFAIFRGKKQMLVFQVIAQVVNVTFGGQPDGLEQPQKPRHVHHRCLAIDVLLGLLMRTYFRNENRA